MPTTDIVIQQPDTEKIKGEFAPVVLQAEALDVYDKHMHGVAQECLLRIRAAEKQVHARIDPIVKQAHGVHKSLTTLRNDLLAPLNEAAHTVNVKLTSYEIQQREIAEEASQDALVEVEPELAQVKGISTHDKYSVEVMDIVLLAEHVTKYPELAYMIIPNTPVLNKLARAQRDAFQVPGCKLVITPQRTVRTG